MDILVLIGKCMVRPRVGEGEQQMGGEKVMRIIIL